VTAVTHQSSAELAALEQAATTLNDSNAVNDADGSYYSSSAIFDGKEAIPFPRIPGHLGNGSPGMQTPYPAKVRAVTIFILTDE